MKKILVILLVCFCFLEGGCSYGGAGLALNSDGSVFEYYYVPFPEQELANLGVSVLQMSAIINNTKTYLETDNPYINGDGLFASLISDYQKAVDQNQEYTIQQKTFLVEGVSYKSELLKDSNNKCIGLQYRFMFENATCYSIFKDVNNYVKENKIVEEINNIFTTTKKILKDPIFDKIAQDSLTIGKHCLQVVEMQMIGVLGDNNWQQIKQELNYDEYSSKFEYTYVVPTGRVHSNADSVEKGQNGYYYHKWFINLNNLEDNGKSIIQIEYWTISANKWVWYVLSLIVAGGIITGTYFVSKFKEKNKKAVSMIDKTNNE